MTFAEYEKIYGSDWSKAPGNRPGVREAQAAYWTSPEGIARQGGRSAPIAPPPGSQTFEGGMEFINGVLYRDGIPDSSAGPVPVSAPPKSVLGPTGVPSPMAPQAIKGGGVSGGLNLGGNRLPPADPFANYYANLHNRIPRGGELEGMSSDTIADFLNPPDFFPEVDRRSAELASGRGIAGSPAGFGAGLRMTDEERLKRIALGQGFLTAAAGRTPPIDPAYMFLTEQQKAQLALDKQKLELQKQAIELDNELKRLQIRNLSTPSVRYLPGGGGVGGPTLQPGTPLHGGWGEDMLAANDAAFGRSIGGWGGTGGGGGINLSNDLPDLYDPNWDWTG